MNSLPDPERARRNAGLTLFAVGITVGGFLLVSLFIGIPLASGQLSLLGQMCLGAALAFPAGLMYLTVPRLLDRYDPEPWYALVGCLLWGGIAACGFSAVINTAVQEVVGALFGASTGELISTVVSAPVVEEFWKAIGVLGVFYFLRREFDGVVDGIIYATFVALGFATVENVIYYGRAAGSEALAATFVLRGVIAPWGHPVYTAMTGIGFGLARETEKAWVRWLAPPMGYAGAVLLHAMWNGSAMLADRLGEGSGGMLFMCMLPVGLLFVTTFVMVVIVLVRRRGRIIRAYLEDEVALRTLSREEVDLVCSAFGLVRARMRYGKKGVLLVRAAARLALSKWHSVRAQNQRTRTVSMDFIVPLRRRIAELKSEMASASPR
jgi:RsiW-degrading membrane proteinase PrsW (M82 family)